MEMPDNRTKGLFPHTIVGYQVFDDRQAVALEGKNIDGKNSDACPTRLATRESDNALFTFGEQAAASISLQ